jgi:hypothetical protein
MALTYNLVEDIVDGVFATSPVPYRPADLAPADRARLAELAARDGVSQEYVLDRARRFRQDDLAARQEARRIAEAARQEGGRNAR